MSEVVAEDVLRQLIERIERLEEEKAALAADISEVYAEAKGRGLDATVMRKVIKLRKMEPSDRMELEAVEALYREALGIASVA